jgi:hypothetical protein
MIRSVTIPEVQKILLAQNYITKNILHSVILNFFRSHIIHIFANVAKAGPNCNN